MRLTLDHIGLAVPSLAEGRDRMARMLPVRRWGEPVADQGLGVEIQFGWDASGIAFELLAPLGEGSPVAAVLKAGRNTLQHLAYRTPDFAEACATFRREGSLPLGPARPARAFGGANVIFFLTPLRFVCELIDSPEVGSSDRAAPRSSVLPGTDGCRHDGR